MPETKKRPDRAPRRAFAPLLALVLLAAVSERPAQADIFPLLNASSVASTSTVQTMTGPLTETKIDIGPPNPMDPWNGSAFSNVIATTCPLVHAVVSTRGAPIDCSCREVFAAALLSVV